MSWELSSFGVRDSSCFCLYDSFFKLYDLLGFCYSLYRHMCRRADGLERTFKYKNVYSDVVVTDENQDLFN
ncbi:hypothetical protein TcWFU_010185 [Taenia crassiceps]|uniref:Uncharacterized protein n=1 Tax=Taenia crassiceps TaxID=6207 RepID=A0ABR4Q9W7_9CEST